MNPSFPPEQEQQESPYKLELVEMQMRLNKVEEFLKCMGSSDRTNSGNVRSPDTIDRSVNTNITRQSDIEEIHNRFHLDEDNFPHSYFRNMTKSISLPGFQFLGERNQPRFHTYLWVFIQMLALLLSLFFIKKEYDSWQSTPVIRYISNNLTLASEIPFPAITICYPLDPIIRSDFAGVINKCWKCNSNSADDDHDNVARDQGYYDNYCFNEDCTHEDQASLGLIHLLCSHILPPLLQFSEVFHEKIPETINFVEFPNYAFKAITLQYDTHLSKELIEYEGGLVTTYESGCANNQCQYSLTNQSVCITVNGLHHEDIYKKSAIPILSAKHGSNLNIEKNYTGESLNLDNALYSGGNLHTIPPYITNDQAMLLKSRIITDEHEDMFSRCFQENKAHTYFAVHSPFEIPFNFENDLKLEGGFAKHFKVVPKLVTTDEGIKSYSPHQRGCYYSDERELSMFKFYTEGNCETECIANCSLTKCGCVPYYLPRHNISIKICLRKCSVNKEMCDCGCLPDCISLSYELKESYKSASYLTPKKSGKKGVRGTSGSIELRYKEKGCYTTVRVGVSITNMSQFLAYCISIFGMLNGFNVMVVFEFLYLITFKLWSSVKMYLHK